LIGKGLCHRRQNSRILVVDRIIDGNRAVLDVASYGHTARSRDGFLSRSDSLGVDSVLRSAEDWPPGTHG
jgi:hypothetical protein